MKLFRKVTENNKIKFCLLGLPIVVKKIYDAKIKIKILGILVYKKIYPDFHKFVEAPSPEISNQKSKELLIVETAHIGDYILFRNFLLEIKNSEQYKDYEISLLISSCAINFATYLDSDTIDNFLSFPYDDNSFAAPDYLYKTQGLKQYYDTIIFPAVNNCARIGMHKKYLYNTMYTNKIIHSNILQNMHSAKIFLTYTNVYCNYNMNEQFAFDMNKKFIEHLLDKKISLKWPTIGAEQIPLDCDIVKNIKNDYIVINPCASEDIRKWHIRNWAEIIKYVKQELNLDIYIICADSEKQYCQELIELSKSKVVLFAGLSISDLLSVLKLAKLYIGQDSGIFHTAAAVGVKSLALSSGQSYFSFMNYPKEQKNVKILFPDNVEEWIWKNKDNPCINILDANYFFINCLKVSNVKNAIDELLKIKLEETI